MWFFKKKKQSLLNTPDQIRNRVCMKAEINLLSPVQIEKVLQNNTDLDFLEQEMKEQMNYPDVDHIIKHLVPQNMRRTSRKHVAVEDIINGVVCGDILGSKFEFTVHNYDEVKTMVLPSRKSYHTDDTVLTKATWKAIQEAPETPDFRQAYLDAYQKEKGAGYGSAFVGWAENTQMFYTEGMVERPKDNTVGYHSCANGCAMRIAPIPAYYDDLPTAVKHAVKSCMVTHDHVESVKAVVILTVAMWMALHGYAKQDIYDYCCTHYTIYDELFHKTSQFDMNTVLSELPNNIVRHSLMANYAVPFAIKCFYETESYETCIREILSHYGDTDTICAIAGGLCVAFYGTTGMNTREILEADLHKI